MRVLVTGGGGFVGKALCKKLIEEEHEVRSLSRGRYPDLDSLGVQQFQIDLASASPEQLQKALSGVNAVVHTAALVSMWGKYEDFYRVNVQGTRNLLEAARKAGVSRFVYTSSPSVVANGSDLRAVDESQPYPDQFLSFYPKTKSIAEQAVLGANSDGFATLSLRPHLIFGPGDTNLIPTVLEKAASGRLKIIGEGKNLVDFCFIDDCVKAHMLALSALESNPDSRGRAYFISQGDPVPMWDWINRLLVLSDREPLEKRVPAHLAMFVAGAAEWLARIGFIKEPPLTRFLIEEMSTDHYFDIRAAQKELGFEPSMGVFEALEQTFADQPIASGRRAA